MFAVAGVIGAPPVVPIVALDVPTSADARRMVERLGGECDFYKVGSELFTAAGPEIVHGLTAVGKQVFLDLKFHDIPTTVRAGVRSAARLGARLVTVHAVGGAAMLAAAREGAEEGSGNGGRGRCEVLAVTVLTSHDAASIGAAWGRPSVDVLGEVERLAESAVAAGLHGVVCSGAEAPALHARFGRRLALLVPGVRLAGGDAHDQARAVTPAAAAAAGARYVVLGRAVTTAADPARALAEAREQLAAGAPIPGERADGGAGEAP